MENIRWKCFLLMVAVLAARLSHRASAEMPNYLMSPCTKDNFPIAPSITGPNETFIGENYTLHCAVNMSHLPRKHVLIWRLPENHQENYKFHDKVVNETLLKTSLAVTNISRENAGKYECSFTTLCGTNSSWATISPKSRLILENISVKKDNPPFLNKYISFFVNIRRSYPQVTNVTFFKNNVPIESLANAKHYQTTYLENKLKAVITIKDATVEDTANYTITVTNGYETKSETFDIRKTAAPKVDLGLNNVTCVIGTKSTYQCKVTGYPLPSVTWKYNDTVRYNTAKDISKRTRIEVKSLYEEIAYLDMDNCDDVNLTCLAENRIRGELYDSQDSKHITVYEVENGFGVLRVNNGSDANDIHTIEYRDLKVKCLASLYKYKKVTWVTNKTDFAQTVKYSRTNHSLVSELIIKNITLAHERRHICKGILNSGNYETDYIDVKVLVRKAPTLVLKYTDQEKMYPLQNVYISCLAQGVPRPKIEWFKDDMKIMQTMNFIDISEAELDYETINSTISIKKIKEENIGKYTCTAANECGEDSQSYDMFLNGTPSTKSYIISICIIVILFSILVVFLIWKRKVQKRRFLENLDKAGLYRFIEGDIECLNPELRIDEDQGHLLPYDNRFEYPAERLKFGIQLGSGAFGVVKKAEARGIINAEETTTVAVKMVEQTADNMHIKALASELKIMIHLGKHINIVNLLGACTENVRKRELLVIVEYCMYGNIHKYIQNHKDVFINESLHSYDVKNGIANIATEHPEGDYSYNGRTKRSLTSRDLLCWGFQIARGMEYLSKRRICHRDLAARNVLLSDDNIVKICDFGLSKSLYKNDEYKRNADSQTPLPIKWLAIECLTEKIFTTQSDVWSFGVVLWEMFSLAKLPYPGVYSVDSLVTYLSQGNRMDKPLHADERMYEVMKKCWERKPTARPSFTELQETLGTFLEDSVRNHIVELGAVYADICSPAPVEDYLTMVCPPDYTTVTSSPHHYVNNQTTLATSPKHAENVQNQDPVIGNAEKSFALHARSFNTQLSRDEDKEETPMIALSSINLSYPNSDDESFYYPLSDFPYIDEKDDVIQPKQENFAERIDSVPNPMYISFGDIEP